MPYGPGTYGKPVKKGTKKGGKKKETQECQS